MLGGAMRRRDPQLEHCMIKFLQNPGLAAAVMEDASLLDVELVPARAPR